MKLYFLLAKKPSLSGRSCLRQSPEDDPEVAHRPASGGIRCGKRPRPPWRDSSVKPGIPAKAGLVFLLRKENLVVSQL